MKKLLLLALLAMPAVPYAQLTVSGVGGENGYSAIHAQYRLQPGDSFYLIPKYSFYQDDDNVDGFSRYGLRAGILPWERLELAAEGSWTPEVNGYSDYMIEGDARYYFLLDEYKTVRNLYLGLGAAFHNYKQEPGMTNKRAEPLSAFDINATRGILLAGADISVLRARGSFSKTLGYSEDPEPWYIIWGDLPYFVAAQKSFVDYYASGALTLPTEYINLTGAYSLYKYKGDTSDSQSVTAAATIKLGQIALTGAVEFRDFDKSYSKTYFSFNASVSLR